jgi:hypothetical protein
LGLGQTADREIDVEHLEYALKHSPEFLINFSIPEELADGVPVPQFHIDVVNDMIGDFARICEALPRDHAKTTLAKITTLWHLFFTDFRFIIYVANAHSLAAAAILDIVNILRSDNWSSYHMAKCGTEIKWLIVQESAGFFKFVLFEGTKNEKTCIIRAAGLGQSMRGMNVDNQRPQLAIVDDMESAEKLEISIELYYKRNKKWFYGTFMKAMDKFKNKIIQLGNMISNKCIVKDHTESKDWHSRRYGAILSNGESLWPDAWPIPKLKLDFELYKRAGQLDTWFAEMMNMPLAIGRGLIKADEIYYRPKPVPEQCEYCFITIDPAISQRTWGHRTSISVHGYYDDCWQIVEQHNEAGIDAYGTIRITIDLCYKWRACVVGIEDVAYQSVLKDIFRHHCLENHIEGIEFVSLYASSAKTARIAGWCGQIKGKTYALNDDDTELTQELLLYDPAKKDNDCDAADSAAYGPQMIANYMDMILNTLPGGQLPMSAYASLADIASI